MIVQVVLVVKLSLFIHQVAGEILLAMASTKHERQIDLYETDSGKLVRSCTYDTLDPGIMCPGEVLYISSWLYQLCRAVMHG